MDGRRVGLALVILLAGSGLSLALRLAVPAGRPAPAERRVPVTVAARDLPFGTILTAADMRVVELPEAAAPPQAARQPDSLVGQTTRAFIGALEPVLSRDLSAAGGGISIRVPADLRAVTVEANHVVGTGELVVGDRVDVLAAIEPRRAGGETEVRTILEDVEVLGVGTGGKDDKRPGTGRPVVLLADPPAAARLTLAAQLGRLVLVLRNPSDRGLASVPPVSSREILGPLAESSAAPAPATSRPRPVAPPVPPRPAPASVAAAAPTVTIIRGAQVRESAPVLPAPLPGARTGSAD